MTMTAVELGIVAKAHCVECKDFIEPIGKNAHAVKCTQVEDEATVAMLVNELDVAIYIATGCEA